MIASCEVAAAHPDPFDRLFLAQAIRQDMTLLTSDADLAGHGPEHVLLVKQTGE